MDCLECKICHVPYDEEGHRPRNSPCGHELCTTCLGALIQDRRFECPKCRQKYKVDSPYDMPVCFGLIDVIRAFKAQKIYLTNYPQSNPSGATNNKGCKIHHKKIGHRCLTCQMWICTECLNFHTNLTQCSTTNSSSALSSMKEKHNGDVNKVLTIFEVKANNASLQIQEFAEMKKVLLEKAEKFGKEEEKLRELLQKGNIHMENMVESKNQMNAAQSPYVVDDKIAVLVRRKQLLHSWTVKNLEAHSIESLIKMSGGKLNVNAKVGLKDLENCTEPSKKEKHSHIHFAKTVEDGCIHLSIDRLQKLIPEKVSLVFMDFTVGSVEKGRVLMRLKKNLSYKKGNIAHIFTGQHGQSLRGTILNIQKPDNIGTDTMPFNRISVTPNSERPMVRRGDVLGFFKKGYFETIFFFIGPSPRYGNPEFSVIGHIEIGMDILQECFDDIKNYPIVSDCGLVIES